MFFALLLNIVPWKKQVNFFKPWDYVYNRYMYYSYVLQFWSNQTGIFDIYWSKLLFSNVKIIFECI